MNSELAAKFGEVFSFKSWHLNTATGHLSLCYECSEYGVFTERFVFENFDHGRYQRNQQSIDAAINCLHWMAGVSYYKTSLAQLIKFEGQKPDEQQASWLTDTWQAGLAELAHENQFPWLDHIQFNGVERSAVIQAVNLTERSLVAIGGGKDSLVSIEAVKSMKEPASLFMVGQSSFIQAVAAKTGLPLIGIMRQVDPKLQQVNESGAINGHIPITAINACVAVVAALIYDYDSIVFSNERSADTGNLEASNGQWINHQYSKSLAYEKTWQNIISRNISADLHCFSLLRPFSELAIVKKFSEFPEYFSHFSSCNRNFHLTGSNNQSHHWCGVCPKCAFVFLCLAPFVAKQNLIKIFAKDLISDARLNTLFESLLGISGHKPFECVGEEQECRLALSLLDRCDDWKDHANVKKWLLLLPEQPANNELMIMRASHKHLIPHKRNFHQILDHVT